MPIRVVSLNCWGGRIPAVVDFLRKMDADIYCLQEVYSAPPDTPSPLTYAPQGELPAHPRLFEDLAAGWPNYQAFFSPHSQGYLHDGASTEYAVRYGLGTFVRNHLPVVEQASRFVFGFYRAHAWGKPPLPRTAHCIRVYDYEQDSVLTVAHMHGLWDKHGKIDTYDREVQVSSLVALIEMTCHIHDERVVVCGDFNVLPDSFTIEFLEAQGLRDLLPYYDITDTRTSYYKKSPRYADYMLVSRPVKVRKFHVIVDPEVSDHRPLLLECD